MSSENKTSLSKNYAVAFLSGFKEKMRFSNSKNGLVISDIENNKGISQNHISGLDILIESCKTLDNAYSTKIENRENGNIDLVIEGETIARILAENKVNFLNSGKFRNNQITT